MSQPLIEPFPFESLPSTTHEEMRLEEAWGNSPEILEQVVADWQQILGTPLTLKWSGLRKRSYDNILATLPERFVFLVVSLTPLSRQVIMALDSRFCSLLIDKLLGGTGNEADLDPEMTALEEGVLQFFAVKILKSLSPLLLQWKMSARLDQVIFDKDWATRHAEAQENFMEVALEASLNDQTSLVRLFLPFEILNRLPQKVQKNQSLLQTGSLDSLPVQFVFEVGKVQLLSSDLSALERGDVVFLDQSTVQLDGRDLIGKVHIRCGKGGFLEGELQGDSNQTEVTLKRFLGG